MIGSPPVYCSNTSEERLSGWNLRAVRSAAARKAGSRLEAHYFCAIFEEPNAEGSHNGIAAVLKTAVRKDMQVRVLSPPPFLFLQEFTLALSELYGFFRLLPDRIWRRDTD